MVMHVSLKEREVGRMIEKEETSPVLRAKAVVSLVDFRHEPSAGSVQMYEFLNMKSL